MGKKVLVIGAARSGLAGAEFLAAHGETVVLTDMKQVEQVDNLAALGVSFIWGEQPDVAAVQPDYIVAVSYTHLDVYKRQAICRMRRWICA